MKFFFLYLLWPVIRFAAWTFLLVAGSAGFIWVMESYGWIIFGTVLILILASAICKWVMDQYDTYLQDQYFLGSQLLRELMDGTWYQEGGNPG